MKRMSVLAGVGVAITILITATWPSARIPGMAINVHAKDRGCTTTSVRGMYGYERSGFNNIVGGPVAEIGLTIFNGDGTFGPGRGSLSRNGEIQDWMDTQSGATYTVDPDCTGSIFDSTGAKTNDFVVVDGGNGFFLISTLAGRTVTAVGKRIDGKDRN